MDIVFFIYPLLLAGTLGLWWLPFFFWKEDAKLKKISGILLWWVNIPLYCLMFGPAFESAQPFLSETMVAIGYQIISYAGLAIMIGGILATLFFLIPRMKAGGPGYDASNLQIRGVFAFMRHPQLASAWLIALGWSLWHGAMYAIITAFLYLIVLRVHAEMEERFLLIPVFGEDYYEYKKKVKAFVPYIF